MISHSSTGKKPKRVSGKPLRLQARRITIIDGELAISQVACWQPLAKGHRPLTVKPSLVFIAFPGGANVIAVTESMSGYISRATAWSMNAVT
jgi:hypothetical protein